MEVRLLCGAHERLRRSLADPRSESAGGVVLVFRLGGLTRPHTLRAPMAMVICMTIGSATGTDAMTSDRAIRITVSKFCLRM